MQPIQTGETGVRQIFERDVPRAFMNDLLRTLVAQTRTAVKQAEALDREVAHDLLPQLRRALMENALAQLPQRHGGTASHMPNEAENSHHVEVVFNRVLMTQHYVRELREVPRAAVFRENLAEQAQYVFPFARNAPVEARPVLGVYAQFLHGPINKRTSFPSFARISFPNADGGEITSIDLTADLSKLFYSQFQPEHIEDDLPLSKKPKTESEHG